MARCACIDIGSNTTRLLVAEADGRGLHEVLSERAFTRLGEACDREIGMEKVVEVAAIVARQVRLARELGVDSLRVVATSAVRDAVDGRELAAVIGGACHVSVEILSGQDEARLAFAGATGMLVSPPPGLLGVVDVGGGSTELVAGTIAEGVSWSVSLPVGSSVATLADLHSDPPTAAQLDRLRTRLQATFGAVQAPQPAAAYAVGGSSTSLQRLLGVALEPAALARGLEAVVARPAADVARRLGLAAERARLLPAGILLLEAASRALGTTLELAGGGLREGIVLEQLAQQRASEL